MSTETKLNWSAMSERERDRMTAEHVIGWKNVHMECEAWADDHNQWHDDFMGSLNGKRTVIPEYTRDIASAFQVVDKLRAEGFVVTLVNSVDGSWGCTFAKGWQRYSNRAATPSESVCLAALRVKGVEV